MWPSATILSSYNLGSIIVLGNGIIISQEPLMELELQMLDTR